MFFLLKCLFTESHGKTVAKIIIPTLILGIVCMSAELYLKANGYKITALSTVTPYFFIPFGTYGAVFLFIGVPLLFYAGKYEGIKHVKWMASFCAMVPGAICFGPLYEMLNIPTGIWNVGVLIVAGQLYLFIVTPLLKKQFQEFYPTSGIA